MDTAPRPGRSVTIEIALASLSALTRRVSVFRDFICNRAAIVS